MCIRNDPVQTFQIIPYPDSDPALTQNCTKLVENFIYGGATRFISKAIGIQMKFVTKHQL
jgi:hypothetical protein